MDTFDSHSDATVGYHLFFLPSGQLAEKLSIIIQELAREYGGPVFEPHVSLLSRIPDADEGALIQKLQALAAGIQPLTLTIGELRSEDSYFCALYAHIIEQDELRALHERASAILGMSPNPAYGGHLSLLYGNYTEEQKVQTMECLHMPAEASFVADSIHLFKTPGTTDTWQKIISVPMSG